jgi:penicillin-binding protein 1C
VIRGAQCIALAGAAVCTLGVAAFFAAVQWWPYPDELRGSPTPSTLVLDRTGEPLAAFAAPDGQWRTPLAEHEINPHLLDAVVAVEDARFFEHGGVDWRAGLAAAWQNVASLRIRRGASTLTMQLHRLRDPRPRSLWAKLEQMIRAKQIERDASKRDILVEYLNRAPFGGNLVGAGAASWRYFGKPCVNLSLGECALLAGLPQSPNRYRPDRHLERATRRRDIVLARMLACGMITTAEHDQSRAEPVRTNWRALPQDTHEDGSLPTLLALGSTHADERGVVTTSLDARVQRQVATAAHEHLNRLRDSGISSAAIVVLDTVASECLAAVSLSDVSKRLDLTRRPRSTGSVLKPFIYAAAFEAGTSAPAAILDDSPAAWPGYTPQDYDRTFKGQMTAADALAESRNIPAMVLLARTGIAHTTGVMQSAGLQTLGAGRREYGLSLAVGGAGATPMEVATAYAGLARGGSARPISLAPVLRGEGWGEGLGRRPELIDEHPSSLRVRPSPQPSPTSTREREQGRFLAARACWQVLTALADPDRTAAVCPEAARLNVAWKTGTSGGNRDAWCAAVTPRRTVVVWMGNPHGEASHALVGRDVAAPLALSLIASLDPIPAQWPQSTTDKSPTQLARRPLRSRFAIISPAPDRQILISGDLSADRQRVPLQAAGMQDSGEIHWFIDGEHLGSASPAATMFWSPRAGRHEIRAVAPDGRAASVAVSVVGG